MRARIFVAAALLLGLASACAQVGSQVLTQERHWDAVYPEGPLWQDGKLYYAEMGADRVSVIENGQRSTFFTQQGCGPTALAPYGEGFLVLCHMGGRVVSIDARANVLHSWDTAEDGHKLRDPNDCYADGHGGVYFSDPGLFSKMTRPHGYVMHLTADGVLQRATGPLWYPNGVFVRGDQVFVSEHMANRVLRFTAGADGMLSDPQVAIDVAALRVPTRYDTPYAETGPDGLEIGPDGDFWVSIYGEGHFLRISPAGRLVGVIETSARYTTNIAFDDQGGAYTTGSFDNQPPYPGEVRFHPASSLTRAAD